MEEILKHSREGQLNEALLDFCHTDFMTGCFDLALLAAEGFDPFYSHDVAFWVGHDLFHRERQRVEIFGRPN